MVERLTWKSWPGAGFFTPWVIIGWIFGYMPWLLLAATALQLAWHLHNQVRLSSWLWDEKRLTPPSGSGNWEFSLTAYTACNNVNAVSVKSALISFVVLNGAESLPDAVVVFRAEGNIVWCNKLAQHLLGFHWPEDSGQPISNLIRTPDFIKYLNKQDFSEPLEMRSPISRSVC